MSTDATLNQCQVCKNQADRKCSSCKLVFYCSTEHQKQDWENHKSTCQPFKIINSESMGRRVIATRQISKDDVIFYEYPLVFGPKPYLIENGPLPCVGCCRIIRNKSGNCPLCLWPACSSDCAGLTDKKRHGVECKILRLRPPDDINKVRSPYHYFRYDILIVLRSLLLQKISSKKWDSLIGLEAHMEKRGPETKTYRVIDEKAEHLEKYYLKPLEEYEKENNTIIPIKDRNTIHKLYAIFDVNASELNEEDIDAEILYYNLALLEHSCLPNTMQVIGAEPDNYKLTLRASDAIKADDGIANMYTHILWGTNNRREHLLQRKYFDCNCKRCADPKELGTYFSCLKCIGSQDNPCGGIQLPLNPLDFNTVWLCKKCGITLPNGDVMEFVNHLGTEVDKVLNKTPTVKELEDTLEKLLVFLHPNHYHVYNIKHSLVQLYGKNMTDSDEIIDRKIKICEELIGVSNILDPGASRLAMYLAVLWNELFDAKFEQLKRKHSGASGENVVLIDELETILKTTQDLLKYESINEAGKKLLNVVLNCREQLYNWMQHN